ncbi:MAG: hypothetical protein LBN40_02085 [Oscillospiraceae bacterium]|jgi:hypothetical protein|nr:hypothetical protein [Oscillospiraceae bacterium]
MDELSELLASLFSGESTDECDCEDDDKHGNDECGGDWNFGSFDTDMMMKLMGLFAKTNVPDKNVFLLNALQNVVCDETKTKIERAKHIMRLLQILPILKECGLFEKGLGL